MNPRSLMSFRPLAFLAVAAIALAGITSAASEAVRRDVPYVPTPHEVVDRMMQLSGVKAGDYVIDFGCGDGRMVIAAAKRGARGYGVDIDPQRIAEANANAKEAGVTDRVSFKIANLFEEDLSKADVMTMYLLTEVNLRLRPKILSDMRPGTRIVSHVFDMGEWEADATDNVNGRDIFMWHVPAKVEGRWQMQSGGQAFTLDLKQQFQKVDGQAQAGGQSGKVEGGRLTGTKFEFTMDVNGKKQKFEGQVKGNEIEGSGWKATRQS